MDVSRSVPRSYQVNLLQHALLGNTIAILPTGSGKEITNSSSQLTVFLVPTVPLVVQQAAYLKSNLNLRVSELFGSMGVDSWGKLRWNQIIDSSDVLVMTPQVLLNALCAGFIGLDVLSLIIFDECHHARKNHPYNQLMEIYRHHPIERSKPKIFGMTASPANSKSDAVESIRVLELNLESKAFTVTDPEDQIELQKFVPRPKEEVLIFEKGPFFNPPELYSMFCDAGGSLIPVIRKELEEFLVELEDHGPWWAERFLELAFITIHKRALRRDNSVKQSEEERREELEDGEVDEEVEIQSSKTELLGFANVILETLPRNSPILSMMSNDNRNIRNRPNLEFGEPASVDKLSGKILKLFELLESYRATQNFSAIIFVEKRRSARILATAIRSTNSLSFIRPTVLIGHGSRTNNFGTSSMLSKEQDFAVREFRNGKYNVLIATSIGEEGIDIQSCMLVVRLSMLQTLINYIQSRGRARHFDSRYILILPADGSQGYTNYMRLLKQEELMNKALVEKEEEDLGEDSAYLLSPEDIFKIDSTGATLTPLNAVKIFNQYCTFLPKDAHCSTAAECRFTPGEVDNEFQATFYLPISVAPPLRTIIGPMSQGKKSAKRNAAFIGVKTLYTNGELDDRFRPIHLQIDDNGKVKAEVSLITGSKVREFHVGVAECLRGQWDGCSKIYLSTVKVIKVGKTEVEYPTPNSGIADQTFAIGIVTIHRIQESNSEKFTFDLPIREGSYNLGIEVYCNSASQELDVTPETINYFRYFHTQLLGAFLRKDLSPEREWGYLLAPISILADGGFQLDHTLLKKTFEKCQKEKASFDQTHFKGLLQKYRDDFDEILAKKPRLDNADPMDANGKDLEDAELRDEEIEALEMRDRTLDESEGATAKGLKVDSDMNIEVGLSAGEDIRNENDINEVIPTPAFTHPLAGSFLELLRSNPPNLPEIIQNTTLIDFYYYGRKYQIIEIIDASPFDDYFEYNTDAVYFKRFKSVNSWYKTRLRCWEEIIPNQPIIKAIQIPHFSQSARMKAFYSTEETNKKDLDFPTFRKSKGLDFVFLLPQFCRIYPIETYLLLYPGIHFPIILRQLDHALLTRDFIKKFDLDFIPPLLTQCALTTPSAHLAYDYERLENLGDSFLKVLISLHLFSKHPTFHEGRLTSERNILEGNRLFTRRGVESGIVKAVLANSLTRLLWVPMIRRTKQDEEIERLVLSTKEEEPETSIDDSKENLDVADVEFVESADDKEYEKEMADSMVFHEAEQLSMETSLISDKTLADCIEALIGASFLYGGIEKATIVSNKIMAMDYLPNWYSYVNMLKEANYYNCDQKKISESSLRSIATLESVLGYQFKNKNLAIEAITHPSSLILTDSSGSCYQRLEFLGDAILHFIVTIYIYKKYPLLSPGAISDYRSTLICNQFLSCVCAALKLHTIIDHNSTSFTAPLARFIKKLDVELSIYRKDMGLVGSDFNLDPVFTASSEGEKFKKKVHFWNDFDDPPKAIADVYEAILGAVFVDSLYTTESGSIQKKPIDELLIPIQKVIHETLLIPWLPLVGIPSAVQTHPIKELFDLCSSVFRCKKVNINCLYNEVDGSFSCRVLFHEVEVGFGEGLSKRGAKKKAASDGIANLKKRFDEMGQICNCSEGMDEEF